MHILGKKQAQIGRYSVMASVICVSNENEAVRSYTLCRRSTDGLLPILVSHRGSQLQCCNSFIFAIFEIFEDFLMRIPFFLAKNGEIILLPFGVYCWILRNQFLSRKSAVALVIFKSVFLWGRNFPESTTTCVACVVNFCLRQKF